MTQTIQNYQETVNTLLFGQKAKNVKTTVNVNEVVSSDASLEKAQKMINELQTKLLMYEKNPPIKDDNGSSKYLQDQVEFLSLQISKLQQDLVEKEMTINKIVMEKNNYAKSFTNLENQNNQLMETLSHVENEKDEA